MLGRILNQIKVLVCSVVKVNIKTKTINQVAKSVTLAGTTTKTGNLIVKRAALAGTMTAKVKSLAKTIAVLDRTLTPTKVLV